MSETGSVSFPLRGGGRFLPPIGTPPDKSEVEEQFASDSACHGVAAQQRRRERNSEPASAGDLT